MLVDLRAILVKNEIILVHGGLVFTLYASPTDIILSNGHISKIVFCIAAYQNASVLFNNEKICIRELDYI